MKYPSGQQTLTLALVSFSFEEALEAFPAHVAVPLGVSNGQGHEVVTIELRPVTTRLWVVCVKSHSPSGIYPTNFPLFHF